MSRFLYAFIGLLFVLQSAFAVELARPSTQHSTQAATQPSTQAATQLSTQAAAQPSTQAATQSAAQSSAQPVAQPFFNANKAAVVTTTSMAVVTAASAVGMSNALTTGVGVTPIVAYSALTLTSVAVSFAAITAWFSVWDQQPPADAGTYFQKVADNTGIAIAGVTQFASMMLVNAVISGLTNGISNRVSRGVGGPDQTIRITR